MSERTVTAPKLAKFKLQMKSLSVYMTDSELEAMKALLEAEYSFPVREEVSSDKQRMLQSLRHHPAETQ